MAQLHRNISLTAAVTLFAASCSHTGAASPASLPVDALAAWGSHARDMCEGDFRQVSFVPLDALKDAESEFYARLSDGDGVFLSGDFNGDGRTDYVVASPEYGCGAEGMPYGRSGSVNDFILSIPAGYSAHRGFVGWLFEAKIQRVADRDMVEFPTPQHGKCGEVAATLLGVDAQLSNVTEYRDAKGQKVDRFGCTEATTSAAKPT